MSKLFPAGTLRDKSGSVVDSSELAGKIVGLYFSAHWCPPCRAFTPVLADKYREITTAGHPFEIVFISSDKDAESAAAYFAEMPWKMLDFSERARKAAFSSELEVI